LQTKSLANTPKNACVQVLCILMVLFAIPKAWCGKSNVCAFDITKVTDATLSAIIISI